MMDIDYGPDHGYDAEYELALEDRHGDFDPADEDAEYQAHLAEQDADYERARARRNQPAPLARGTRLPDLDGQPGYFCPPCWKGGVDDGFHAEAAHPCDAENRGPYDPR